MIGFNHALVGGLLGKVLPWPIAVPLALASHFALDTLPHYGINPSKRNNSKFWKVFFAGDFVATFSLAVWAVLNHHYAMFAAGLTGVMPDFIWVARVIRTRSYDFSSAESTYEKWHIRIQKYEFPGGIWIELPLAVSLFYLVIVRTT